MGDREVGVYVDAGCTVRPEGAAHFRELCALLDAEHDIVGFQLPAHPERVWTKAEVFTALHVPPNDPITKSPQLVGGIIVFRKTPSLVALLEQYRTLAMTQPHLFSDELNASAQAPEFRDHRHDQSVFSVLRKQYGRTRFLPDETWAEDWTTIAHTPFHATRRRDGPPPSTTLSNVPHANRRDERGSASMINTIVIIIAVCAVIVLLSMWLSSSGKHERV
jgi:hypothetical protein